MDWLKNRKVQQFAAIGFLGGILLLISGLWLALNRNQLSLTLWSFSYIHRINPMLFILDLTPIILAIMAGLLGLQSSLSATIARGKKEWETIFDSFSDLIFVTESNGMIVRCNHAVIDHLNTRYMNVIGKPISEILSPGKQDSMEGSNGHEKGFSWLGRLYDVSTVPIGVEGTGQKNLFILRDVTRRKESEAALEQSETLFRGLFDLSPDAIVVIDPHAPNVSWPIIDCNMAACIMNGYQREQLIGQSIDILNLTSGTPDERMAYLNGLREVGHLKLETEHRRKNGELFPVDVSTSLIRIGERELIIGIDRDITERKQAEEELAKQQYLVNAMLNTTPDYIYFKDIESRFIRTSRSHAKAFGLSDPAEVIGKTDFDFFTEEHARPAYEDEQEIMRTGQPFYKEERETWPDRPDTWVMTTKMPLHNQQNEIIGTFGITRDITERKKVEEELAKQQYLLNAMLNTIPDYVYFKDIESRFIRTSRSHAKAFGLSDPAEVIGKTDFDFFTEEHARPAYEDEQEIMRTGQPFYKEERETWPDRPDTWVIATKMPLRNQQGEVIGTFGISKDITERKRVETELLREKQFLEAVILNSPAAIVVLDNQGNIVSCNPAFEQLYGYTSTEAIGKNLDTLITTPETIDQASTFTQQALTSSVHGFGKRRRKDGRFASVEIFGVPIVLGEEKISTLVIYHDITELDRTRREAEEANRAKGEFLANMSHELRTPMNGVMGMLELALDTTLTSEQRDYLQTSLQSAEALLTLLNDILDFSKIEAGKLELDSINFSLRNAVEDVAYTLAKRAQDKGLEMACLIDPDLSSDLRGDPGRLRQILVNLVGNAIKFTHQGEIVIQAEPLEETQTHTTVHFSVQDTGVGIPNERRAAVFDRFTQADGSTTRKYGGTGLGLTISKQLVDIMGGKIGVDSTPGVGSTFWFDLKFQRQHSEKRVTAPLTLGPVNLTQARILIIDDNQTNRMILIKNVQALGSRVDAVPSGAKGMEVLRNAHRGGDPYHVVLLDMQMPGMDGEQTARAVKSDPAMKDVKILILTSMGQRGDAARLEALGCSGYLLKPVKQQLLFDAIVAVLGHEEEQSSGLITRHTLSEHRKLDLRILLAEDNPINQKLAMVLLQKAGYSVDAVENGALALEKIQVNHYSVILMDVQMPEMDGFEATHQIREQEKKTGQHIPIIAMTAHAMQGDRERCIEAGMDDYVTKPLQPKVLFSALDRWTQAPVLRAETIAEPVEAIQDYSSSTEFPAADMDDGFFGESAPATAGETKEAAPAFQTISFADVQPADFGAALVHFDGDRVFMLEMFKEYKAHLGERVDEIQSALQDRDANRLARLAHNLKGVSLNFSADPLAAITLSLEEICKREDLTHAPALVAQLDFEARRLEEFLSNNL